jgi:mono/diheme cytochrome c family protein
MSRITPADRVIVLVLLSVVPHVASGQGTVVAGRDLYTAACVNCHGADGRGVAEAVVGFADPLPDFTDCSFASREAAADWYAVVHQGGPVRAFSRRMPAFGVALKPDEIDRVVAYVQTLCTEGAWPRGELNLPRPLVTEKAFPEDETVLTASGVAESGSRSVGASLIYERRFGPRTMWELVLPVSMLEQPDSAGGWSGMQLGDVAVAIKHALSHSGEHGHILSVGLEVVLPTGDADKGFGKGTTVFEPFLAAAKTLPRDAFVQAQAGLEMPADKDKAEGEWFGRAAIGATVGAEFGRAFTPMVEVVSSGEFESGSRASFDLVPQVQFSLSKRQHILANVGIRLPVTDRDTRQHTLLAYILWDWFDGGFFDGW